LPGRFAARHDTFNASGVAKISRRFEVPGTRLTGPAGTGLKYEILYPEKGVLANAEQAKKPIKIGVSARF
jgi:hypothetical protein